MPHFSSGITRGQSCLLVLPFSWGQTCGQAPVWLEAEGGRVPAANFRTQARPEGGLYQRECNLVRETLVFTPEPLIVSGTTIRFASSCSSGHIFSPYFLGGISRLQFDCSWQESRVQGALSGEASVRVSRPAAAGLEGWAQQVYKVYKVLFCLFACLKPLFFLFCLKSKT